MDVIFLIQKSMSKFVILEKLIFFLGERDFARIFIERKNIFLSSLSIDIAFQPFLLQ